MLSPQCKQKSFPYRSITVSRGDFVKNKKQILEQQMVELLKTVIDWSEKKKAHDHQRAFCADYIFNPSIFP